MVATCETRITFTVITIALTIAIVIIRSVVTNSFVMVMVKTMLCYCIYSLSLHQLLQTLWLRSSYFFPLFLILVCTIFTITIMILIIFIIFFFFTAYDPNIFFPTHILIPVVRFIIIIVRSYSSIIQLLLLHSLLGIRCVWRKMKLQEYRENGN